MDFAQEITDRVSMNDILAQCGLEPNNHGFICCPFHNEKTPSFKVYKDGTRFKCFGCGEGGSVIDFAMKYYNLSFKQVIIKLNYDFNIGLPIGRKISTSEAEQIRKVESERKVRLAIEKANRQRKTDVRDALEDKYAQYHIAISDFTPKTPDEEINLKYVEGIQNISYIGYLLDNFDEFYERGLLVEGSYSNSRLQTG